MRRTRHGCTPKVGGGGRTAAAVKKRGRTAVRVRGGDGKAGPERVAREGF